MGTKIHCDTIEFHYGHNARQGYPVNIATLEHLNPAIIENRTHVN